MIPSTYPPADEIARLTARMLLEIGAVHFNAETPYIYSSGLPGPTYIDCRKLISYPRIRSTLMDFLAVTVMRNAGFEAFDNIAGGETAGIPFAALMAERLALPMTYVRKKPKGHGRGARIEGTMTEGQRVLLVEDLTTDGGSKIGFVDAIRETGATCAHTAVIFYYGIFPDTIQTIMVLPCITCALGGTFWPRHAPKARSTTPPCARSRRFSKRPAHGRTRAHKTARPRRANHHILTMQRSPSQHAASQGARHSIHKKIQFAHRPALPV